MENRKAQEIHVLHQARQLAYVGAAQRLGLSRHILECPIVLPGCENCVFTNSDHEFKQLSLGWKILEHLVSRPVIKLPCLESVSFAVACAHGRTAALDVTIVQEHDPRTRLESCSQTQQESAPAGLGNMRKPEPGECGIKLTNVLRQCVGVANQKVYFPLRDAGLRDVDGFG